MHEMGIATEIVRIVIESIPDEMADAKVARINIKIGQLSAVVPKSLRFCFDIVAKQTPAEGAELNIQLIPISCRCNDCANSWEITGPVFSCPRCSSGSIEMLTGRELDIESIELMENQ